MQVSTPLPVHFCASPCAAPQLLRHFSNSNLKNPFTRPMPRPPASRKSKRVADGRLSPLILPRTSSTRTRFGRRAWPGRCRRSALITLGPASRSTPARTERLLEYGRDLSSSLTSTRTLRSFVWREVETPAANQRPGGFVPARTPSNGGPWEAQTTHQRLRFKGP